MWSSDSGITEFTVILSKHVFYLYDQTSQSQFYPNNKQPGSSEMDCQCELALPHRRGGLRASCSCLTHLSGSSTLSLRKRRTRDTRSSFLLFVSMIHSSEVRTTGESKPVGLTYNWTASGSALSSSQHTCTASTPPLNHEEDLETLEKLFHLGSQLSHSGSAAPDLLHLRPRPRLRAADHWGFSAFDACVQSSCERGWVEREFHTDADF